jgi:hypothetical protein
LIDWLIDWFLVWERRSELTIYNGNEFTASQLQNGTVIWILFIS